MGRVAQPVAEQVWLALLPPCPPCQQGSYSPEERAAEHNSGNERKGTPVGCGPAHHRSGRQLIGRSEDDVEHRDCVARRRLRRGAGWSHEPRRLGEDHGTSKDTDQAAGEDSGDKDSHDQEQRKEVAGVIRSPPASEAARHPTSRHHNWVPSRCHGTMR
jgi:hypothetical protein